jgi:serine/threonine-protein kinase
MAGLQGRVFGGYQLAEQLHSAGIAEVYRARPGKPGGREAVVKVVYPEFARQAGFLSHFRQIVQTTSRLASHPHILPLLASGEESGYLYLITPYVAGGTLKDWLAGGGRMGPGDVGPFFRQLCDALSYAHSLGVVHGNVKPTNVFLYEGRHVMLGDFGLLWDVGHMDMDHAGSGVEVVEYLAPELAHGQISQQSDIYSTGAVLFAAITGQAPFRGARPADVFAAHARQPVPHLAQIAPTLSAPMQALDAVIQHAMAKRPEQRFPSAAALANEIDATVRQAAAQMSALSAPLPPPGQMPVGLPAASSYGQQGLAPQRGSGVAVPPLGQGLAQSAAALFGQRSAPSGGDPRASSIRPLGPQFPPLPPSATVDESMEQVRQSLRAADGAPPSFGAADFAVQALPTAHMPAPNAAAFPLAYEPTQRMPAPPLGAPPLAPNVSVGTGMDGFIPGGQPGDAASARGAFQLGGARSGLGRRLGAGGAPGLDAAPEPADDEEQPARLLPAIAAPDAAAAPATYRTGFDFDSSGWMEGTGEYGASADDSRQVRAFSPTQLGLPRLTSPALGNMPPGWQEVLSASLPAVEDSRRWPRPDAPPAAAELDGALSYPSWRSGPNGNQEGRSSDAEGWSESSAAGIAWSAPVAVAASAAKDAAWQGQDLERRPARSASWNPFSRPAPEDDLLLDTAEGGLPRKLVRRLSRRRSLVKRLSLLLVILALFDICAIVVLRPDLCPTRACASISAKVHTYLPFLNGGAAQAAAPFSAVPSQVQLLVVPGKAASTALTLSNKTNGSLAWKADVGLPWIIVAPASGAFSAGGSVTLTVMANSAGVKPATYTTSVTVSSAQGTITVPLSVVVADGAPLAITPNTLTFASCGASQSLTVKNTSTIPLNYSATSVPSSGLTLANASGTIPSGGSATVGVTITCPPSPGTTYTITVASGGATLSVHVHVGS